MSDLQDAGTLKLWEYHGIQTYREQKLTLEDLGGDEVDGRALLALKLGAAGEAGCLDSSGSAKGSTVVGDSRSSTGVTAHGTIEGETICLGETDILPCQSLLLEAVDSYFQKRVSRKK